MDDLPGQEAANVGHQRPGHHQRGSFDGWMEGLPQRHLFTGIEFQSAVESKPDARQDRVQHEDL